MNRGTMTAIGGAVLFVLGLLIGLMAGSGPDVKDIDAIVAKRIDAAAASENERLAALEASLGGRLDQIGSGVEANAAAAGEAATRLGADVQGLGKSLAGAIETSAATSLTALQTGMENLRAAVPIAAPVAAPAAAPAAKAAAAAAAPEVAATPPAAAPTDAAMAPAAMTSGATFGAGETAMLSDGALRVFVSRVDAQAGTTQVRIAGADMTLAVGKPEMVPGATACRLTLDAIDGNRAAMSGACGDALPAPEGVAPGATVNLAEGLRVFVSGTTDAGARIAINGVTTRIVPVGSAVDVAVGDKTCTVTVQGVDRGRVALGGACS